MSTDSITELPTAGADRHAPLFAQLLHHAGAAMGLMSAVKDAASGRYEWVSPAWAHWLGRDVADLVGHTDADWCDAATSTALRAADQAALARGGVLTSEHRIEAQGQRHDVQVMRLAGPVGAEGRQLIASLWLDQQPARQKAAQLRQALEQIEQLQRANDTLRRELKDQGLRDQDSGLYTRGHFEDQLRREVDLSTREHREFALVFIAVDPAVGKAAALGDAAQIRILEAMGRLLRGNTRAMDASCRFDERRFAVLLSGVGLATAHSRMEGLRRQCATQVVVHEGQELGFSTSMGVASFPHTAHNQDELMAACEAALAEAQRRGGNHVTLAAIRFDLS